MPPENQGSSQASASISPTSSLSPSHSHRDYSRENEQHDGRPRTPQHKRSWSHPSNAFSPTSPPKLPSPMTMSLYHLGIGSSPLSPFRRQFSSSAESTGFSKSLSSAIAKDGAGDADDELSDQESADAKSSPGEDDDLTQDSRDILVDRLNDLLQHLSTGASLRGRDVTALHSKVDEMEKMLASDPPQKSVRYRRAQQRSSILQLASPLPVVRDSSSAETAEDEHHPDYWGFTVTPPKRQPIHRLAGPSSRQTMAEEPSVTDPDTPEKVEAKISSEVADRLVVEAEKLCTELNTVLKNLQDRREESDHLHAMLIDRAESAATRIMELDDLVSTLEDEVASNKSDLEHLRLQLRAVEVLCHEYVPPDADPDLLQSIENWKSDYVRLKVKMASRRRERDRNPLSAVASPSPGEGSVMSPTTSMMERAGLMSPSTSMRERARLV